MPQRIALMLILATATALAGCGEERAWNTKDVSGLMPDLELELTQASTGNAVTEEAWADKIRVVFFGFTHCPDVCPATLAKYSQALQGMDPETADAIRILFISVDPKRDTLERLDEYASAFGERFVGLRGEVPYLRDLTKRYRVTFGYGEPDENGYYDVSHSSAAFVFDRDGELRLLTRPDDSIEALQADLERLVNE